MWMENPPRLPGTFKRVTTGETTRSPTTVYSVLPSSISSLSVKQLIPPELPVWNIPFLQRQAVCVFWKVSWLWVTWSWSAENLLETSSWLFCKEKQSIFRAPRFGSHVVMLIWQARSNAGLVETLLFCAWGNLNRMLCSK